MEYPFKHKMVAAALTVFFIGASHIHAIDIDTEQNKRLQELERKVNQISGGVGSGGNGSSASKGLQQKVDDLQKQVEELKSKQQAQGTPGSLNTTYGSLTIKGIMQTQFDKGQNGTPISCFKLARMRLLFFGQTPVKQVSYFIQSDLNSTPAILDAKMMWKYIPLTTVNFGRFVPNFTYYMPRTTADLDFVNYPLVVQKYAMFRQNGAQVDVKSKYVALNGGIFNGYPANSTTDTNNEKDYLARMDITPMKDMAVFGYAWLGKESSGAKTNYAKDRFGGGVSWRCQFINFVGEYIGAYDEKNTITSATTGRKTEGWYANLGIKFFPWLEILGRFDRYDPNTRVKSNEEQWTTVGTNIFHDKNNIKYTLNYIFKDEASNDIDNDEVIAQVQIAF